MAYVFQEGPGKTVAAYSTCSEIAYAQADLLMLVEKLKTRMPDACIIGECDNLPNLTPDRLLAGYSNPENVTKLKAFHAEILSKGFQSFTLKPYTGDFLKLEKRSNLQVSRGVAQFMDHVADFLKNGINPDDLPDLVEDIYANPLHAGIHAEFKAAVPETAWITDAAKAMRRMTPDRWLRRMLTILRSYLHGTPREPLPNKNDRCPCGSTRKYARCCGAGVDHDDPEDCKLGNHDYSIWKKMEKTYIRSCSRCYRVFEAPWFEDFIFEGSNLTVVGCTGCGQKPTPEELHQEIDTVIKCHSCASCGKPFELKWFLIEHAWIDGKHSDHWVVTHAARVEDSIDLSSDSLGQSIFLHKECVDKAFPGLSKDVKWIHKGRL